MRGAHAVAAAMRAPDGTIVTHSEPLTGIYRSRWMKVPFVRGLTALWDALGLGTRFLMMSADLQEEEAEKPDGKSGGTTGMGGVKNLILTMTISMFTGEGMFFTVALSLLIAVALFFAMPAFVGHLAEQFLGLNSWMGNLVEGLIRLLTVIGYIWGVGRLPEIARVFAYHGAEHKTINAFEAGEELTVENVLKQSLQHPRCGTAFLLTMVVLSVIVFSLMGPLPGFWRIATRVLFVPVLAGISYEYIRWSARNLHSPVVKLLVKPNLALQSLTTREPDVSIVEVAITAFKTMQEKEQQYQLNA